MTLTVKPIIGMEIHIELATQTKIFCRCRNQFGDPANTHTCPVCIGLPGALPVLNAQAIDYSIKVGLALGCGIAKFTKWDRKNYYYPDLPKAYQISQYDLPLAGPGVLNIPLESGTKDIRVLRAHLEEDAGKLSHDIPGGTGVDLNRAGVPLLEIVSEPDLNTVEEVVSYAKTMHRLIRWLKVSEANMQMGHMRFEPNINLHITQDGVLYKTPIIEVKNLNSFRSVEGAVRYEIRRQFEEWKKDPDGFSLAKRGKQNRGFDPDTEETVFQRDKEEAHDYRYFPDPDLMPVTISDQQRDDIAATIGELPLARRARYIAEYGLEFKNADALTMDEATGDLLDAAIGMGADAKRCVNFLLSRGAAIANERGCVIAEIGLTAEQLAGLVKLVDGGKVSASAGSRVFDAMIESGDAPEAVAEAAGLMMVTDTAQVTAWVDQAIAENPEAVEMIQTGHKKAGASLGFLTGAVMKLSRGAANAKDVQAMLKQKLEN